MTDNTKDELRTLLWYLGWLVGVFLTLPFILVGYMRYLDWVTTWR